MAYKRTTTKSGNSRRTTTISTKGPPTNSLSLKSGNVVTTRTTKGNKSYTTQTIKLPGGYVERKRISSSIRSPNRRNKAKDSGIGIIIVAGLWQCFYL
jgi:hypothetical protein